MSLCKFSYYLSKSSHWLLRISPFPKNPHEEYSTSSPGSSGHEDGTGNTPPHAGGTVTTTSNSAQRLNSYPYPFPNNTTYQPTIEIANPQLKTNGALFHQTLKSDIKVENSHPSPTADDKSSQNDRKRRKRDESSGSLDSTDPPFSFSSYRLASHSCYKLFNSSQVDM
jgi:hypothetical protein